MKKSKIAIVFAILLSGSILCSSCVGSFSLFNRISTWNQNVSNKFVNELVFLALNIIPVYGVCYVADALVINSIEFWTGSNPMANIGEIKTIKGKDGNYIVKTTENGYSINKEGENTITDLIYNEKDQTWNAVSQGTTYTLLKMNHDETADLYLPDGTTTKITLDAQGKIAAHQIVMQNVFATR